MEVNSECTDQYNLSKTCRACLNIHGTMVDILRPGEREDNLLCIYTGIVSSEVVKTEYPFLICLQCEEKLLQNLVLEIQSRKSNAIIVKHLTKKADVTFKKESNIHSSEDDFKSSNDIIDSDVGVKKYVGYATSRLKQFPKNEVIQAINDLEKLPLPPQVFKCTLCPYENKFSLNIYNHMSLIHRDVKHKWCSICNQLYEDLSIHTKQSHSPKELQCKFCNGNLQSKSKLLVHLRRHGGIKPYKCTKCDMEFVTLDQMHQHHHDYDHGKPIYCDICNRNFKKPKNFEKHMALHKPDEVKLYCEGKLTGGKSFICNMCNKEFTRYGNLRTHMRIHTDEKSYRCTLCGKSFLRNTGLTEHMKTTHSTERPFRCNYCPLSFKGKKTLKAHEDIHTGEKSNQCAECGKTFFRRGQLKCHMLTTHGTERPFQCSYCSQAFKQIALLKSHENLHTGVKKYDCYHCPVSYNNKCSIISHLKAKHFQHEKCVDISSPCSTRPHLFTGIGLE